jgi:hypothetical protein
MGVVSGRGRWDVDQPLKLVLSGLSSLIIEGVKDDAGTIVVRASTPPGPVAARGCAVETGRVHGYVERRVADVPLDGRPVVVQVRARPAATFLHLHRHAPSPGIHAALPDQAAGRRRGPARFEPVQASSSGALMGRIRWQSDRPRTPRRAGQGCEAMSPSMFPLRYPVSEGRSHSGGISCAPIRRFVWRDRHPHGRGVATVPRPPRGSCRPTPASPGQTSG